MPYTTIFEVEPQSLGQPPGTWPTMLYEYDERAMGLRNDRGHIIKPSCTLEQARRFLTYNLGVRIVSEVTD